MSINTFVADSTVALASRINTTVNLPTGALYNHVKVISFGCGPGTALTKPASWTEMTGSPYQAPAGYDIHFYWTFDNSSSWTVTHLVDFTNAYVGAYIWPEPNAPIDVNASTATGTGVTVTASAITTVKPYVMRIFYAVLFLETTTSLPTGMTEREDGATNATGVFEELQAVPGTSGTEATTQGLNQEWAAIMFGLAPRPMRLAACGAG